MTAEDLFWEKVDTHGPLPALRPDLGVCWLWLGAHTPDGYARINWKGQRTHAHRVAWELAWGEPIPKGLRLEHFACGLRGCVNPAHVRPKVAVDTVLGARGLTGWNATHTRCVMGHELDQGNVVYVPGGIGCRACRHDVEAQRRRATAS